MPKPATTPITEAQLRKLEVTYPAGLTMFQILDCLAQRKINISEASLRRYVHLGLLPQSWRARRGGGGKHSGSQGLYPPETVRYLLLIQECLCSGATLASLQRTIGRQHQITGLRHSWTRIRALFAGEVPEQELRALDAQVEDLIARLLRLAKTLS